MGKVNNNNNNNRIELSCSTSTGVKQSHSQGTMQNSSTNDCLSMGTDSKYKPVEWRYLSLGVKESMKIRYEGSAEERV